MKLQVCAKTDVGRARKNNEDLFFVDVEQGLFVVADGMGGHAAGEVASQIAIETVCSFLPITDCCNPQEQLQQALEKANQAVEQAANGNPKWKKMGTTLSIVLLHNQRGYLAHVGDSRVYCLHNSQLEQISDDHSLVGEQIRLGIITPEQAKTSTFSNVLLQAIGVTPELDICQKNIKLASGDRLLLCSDGLTDMVNDAEIERTLKQPDSLNICCDKLVEKALAAGGRDNITVVVLQIDQLNQK